ncbi:unnamed protein product [Paramecium octaurelia]|uniref:Uncharacterized protein n=1 Tax=Paramecium octaurelia TaxID=43137 RepID=A0A8S1WSB1_PAROT|nr:unnamed protein product [Paramecium octaurelia]
MNKAKSQQVDNQDQQNQLYIKKTINQNMGVSQYLYLIINYHRLFPKRKHSFNYQILFIANAPDSNQPFQRKFTLAQFKPQTKSISQYFSDNYQKYLIPHKLNHLIITYNKSS